MAQIQHYVPQSVLRRFCDRGGQLHVFDKRERRVFKSSPRNVAAERDFYDIETSDGRLSLENHLSRLEGEAAEIVTQILTRQELGLLTAAEHRTIAEFAAVQFVRIPGQRERFKDMSDQMVEALRAEPPSNADPSSLPDSATDEDAKLSSIKLIVESLDEFAPHFLSKAWLLFEAPSGRPFWISDSPISLHNSVPPPAPFMGNLGLAVRGIEIYLPISPTHAFGFICPSIAVKILDGHGDSLQLRHEFGEDIAGAEGVGYLADGVRYGFPVPAQPGNMDLMNSLQVVGSERWIFSLTSDFSLAEGILDDNPDVASGPRFGVR